MMNSPKRDELLRQKSKELLQRAFQLAFFIYPDKEAAFQLTINAMEGWEIVCAGQDKRRRYSLKGRPFGNGEREAHRTKVFMHEDQLLQRLIYYHSEIYEVDSQQRKAIDEQSLIIHYIKYLVWLTIRNNSFHATVGMSRVLHRYSNRETVNIFMALASNRAMGDYANIDNECKKFKGELMKQLKKRFEGFVTTHRTEQKEERFEAVENPDSLVELVQECLCRFMPWGTECVQSANEFIFSGLDPDSEHSVELKRIHSVIHPFCYAWLTQRLGLALPKERLEIPQFSLSQSSGNGSADRRRPPDMSEEFDNAVEKISDLARRRKSASIGSLSVIVDGKERAQLELNRESSVHIEVAEDSKLIEVRRKEDGLLLALHLLADDDTLDKKQPTEYNFLLEGGQEISLSISLLKPLESEEGRAAIDVSYRETSPIRAAKVVWRRLLYKLSQYAQQNWRLAPRFSLGILSGAIIVVGLLLYLEVNIQPPEWKTSISEEIKPTESVSNPSADPVEKIPTQPEPVHSPKPSQKESPAVQPSATPPNPAVRSPQSLPTTLMSIRKIYVDSLGDDDWSNKLREALIEYLNATGRLVVVEDMKQADAVLQQSPINKDILLVNLAGDTLWKKEIIRNDDSVPQKVGAGIVNDLLLEVEKSPPQPVTF